MSAARLLLASLACAFVAPRALAQALVKDINAVPPPPDVTGSTPNWFAEVGGMTYFSAFHRLYGFELWRSDGTAGGTSLVADLLPGRASSNPEWIVDAGGGVALFAATHPDSGKELWRTDGTAAGTSLVVDLWPGPAGAGVKLLTPFAGKVFFVASDGVTGEELWSTDGTAAGTQLVADLAPGGDESTPRDFTVHGGELFFAARASNGSALLKTDGTPSGTIVLRSFPQTPLPSWLASGPGGLYFRATQAGTGEELWRSDGTPGGTQLFADLWTGPESSGPSRMVDAGGRLFFSAMSTRGREPWTSDGTVAGTRMILDLDPGEPSSLPYEMTPLAGGVVFAARRQDVGVEMWFSDGTAAGTVLLADANPGAAGGVGFPLNDAGTAVVGGKAVNLAVSPTSGAEIWSTDGTPAGTALLADLKPGPQGQEFNAFLGKAVINGEVWFRGDDGLHAPEPWRSDGTAAGTVMVADIHTLPQTGQSFISELTELGRRVFFAADDGVHGMELWTSDGTDAGTSLVADLVPGSSGSDPHELFEWNGRIYFAATDPSTGEELYVSDGTAAGTMLLADIHPGSESSFPAEFTAFAGALYFTASEPVQGGELWRTDGTTAGTQVALPLDPGTSSSGPTWLVVWRDRLYFAYNHPSAGIGTELWSTDGTAAGTGLVADLWPGSLPGFATDLVATDDFLVFDARGAWFDPIVPVPWAYDGAASGPQPLGSLTSPAKGYVALGGKALFRAFADGLEIWSTDGTAAGTQVTLEVNPAPSAGGALSRPAVAGDVGYFWGDDGVSGPALWRTDGSTVGTSSVAPLDPQWYSVDYTRLAAAGSGPHLVFQASEPGAGTELFVSDGTAAGTRRLTDVAPSDVESFPRDFTRAGNLLFFTADDGTHARELFVMPLEDTGAWVAEPFGFGCAGTRGGMPSIHAEGAPVVGSSFDVVVENARPFASAVLVLAATEQFVPLGGGCTSYVAAPALLFNSQANAVGEVRRTFPIAANPALAGARVVFQAVVIDHGGGGVAGLFDLTQGLEVVIGP